MSYQAFAYFYDELMKETPYDQWYRFFNRQFQKYGNGGNRILDVACGTGEIALRMKKASFDVIGVDISTDMLTVAHNKAMQQQVLIPFYEQNMTDLNGLGTYDAITIFCDSLNYLETERDVQQTFERVYAHLQPGGMFLFDVHSLYKMESIFKNATFGLNDEAISYIWHCFEGEYDYSVEHDLTFFVADSEQMGLYQRYEEYHFQRTFPIGTYKKWLETTGFEVLDIQGNFTFEETKETSERIFFTARRV